MAVTRSLEGQGMEEREMLGKRYNVSLRRNKY
jgi:hypothetical protein